MMMMMLLMETISTTFGPATQAVLTNPLQHEAISLVAERKLDENLGLVPVKRPVCDPFGHSPRHSATVPGCRGK